MSDPLGMKAHCSDKRLIQSSLHHIHIPHTLLPHPSWHPCFQSKVKSKSKFSIYHITCSLLNKSLSKFTMANFFPQDCIEGCIRFLLYSVCCIRWQVVVIQKDYFPSYEINKNCFSFTHQVFFLKTLKGNVYLASRISKRLASSPAYTGFTTCIRGGKDKHNKPVVCQLGGYNYWEEGGIWSRNFTAVMTLDLKTVIFLRASYNRYLCCKSMQKCLHPSETRYTFQKAAGCLRNLVNVSLLLN